jgi:hypothetical protein
MKKTLAFLGVLNALFMSILMWILLIILLVFKQVSKLRLTKYFILVIELKNDSYFYQRFFIQRNFLGFSMGNTILMGQIDSMSQNQTLRHEVKHCYDSYIFGILFLPVYLLDGFYIYFFKKDLHPYYDNWFELRARSAAGQQVHIPKSQWLLKRSIFC